MIWQGVSLECGFVKDADEYDKYIESDKYEYDEYDEYDSVWYVGMII